jgi:hypothetical protein
MAQAGQGKQIAPTSKQWLRFHSWKATDTRRILYEKGIWEEVANLLAFWHH